MYSIYSKNEGGKASSSTATTWVVVGIVALLFTTTITLVHAEGEPCTQDPDCTAGHFCGTDSTCHWFGCVDFFTYGPSDFTGQQDGMTSGVELSCEPYVPSGDDGPFAVSLGCDQPVLNSPVPPGEGYAFPFTSHCTATPAVGLIFECYDLDGGTVDFTPFLDSVATGDAIECASDPTYFFNVATTNFLAMEGGGVDANTVYFTVGSKTMNTDFAVNSSMFSSLVSEPSPAPTAIPTPSPTIKQSSANTMLGNGIRFFGLVLFSATLASISVLF